MTDLGPLNTTNFFCTGCGISKAPADGEACPTCVCISRAARQVRGPESMPLKIHLIFALALLVLIAGLTMAFQLGK